MNWLVISDRKILFTLITKPIAVAVGYQITFNRVFEAPLHRPTEIGYRAAGEIGCGPAGPELGACGIKAKEHVKGTPSLACKKGGRWPRRRIFLVGS